MALKNHLKILNLHCLGHNFTKVIFFIRGEICQRVLWVTNTKMFLSNLNIVSMRVHVVVWLAISTTVVNLTCLCSAC
jgi:hypothetical protein